VASPRAAHAGIETPHASAIDAGDRFDYRILRRGVTMAERRADARMSCDTERPLRPIFGRSDRWTLASITGAINALAI